MIQKQSASTERLYYSQVQEVSAQIHTDSYCSHRLYYQENKVLIMNSFKK